MEHIGNVELAMLKEEAEAYELMVAKNKLPEVKDKLIARLLETVDKRLALEALISTAEVSEIFELYKIVSYVIKEESQYTST